MNHSKNDRSVITGFLNGLVFILLIGCSNAKNSKEAYGIEISNQKYIKLYGERKPMSHSPTDLFAKNYVDSILIPVPSFESGIVKGNDIEVQSGYKFLGTIAIKGNNLKVDLLIDDTDNMQQRPYSWNGNYDLIIK